MAKPEKVANLSTKGEWLARDLNGWRVRVPTQGGHQYFPFDQYGGSAKALQAARRFHAKMLVQLKKDREYMAKHGEKPKRPSLNIRNRSGYTGISRAVYPTLDGARVQFCATWCEGGRQYQKCFTTAQYETEEAALKAAIAYREEKMAKIKRKRR